MATARINDIDLYYEQHGDPASEPLLLIMGFMMNAAAWASQVPAFAERYRVVAFDNRGAGRTTQPEAAYSIPQMAGDAAGLLDHLGIASAHVLGASMGGMIAQELAIRHPARVRGLVLACTTPGGPYSAGYGELRAGTARANEVDDVATALTPELVGEFLGQLFTPEFLANPGPGFGQMAASFVQYPQTLAGLKGQAVAIAAHDAYDRLGQIAAPTLVIAGDADPLIDPANSRILAERIPGAELRLMPGLRHGFNVERPDEFNAIVLEFLARRAAVAA
ncbi:MAG: alpha/beta fold hydrolase [Dehalococcoidia bacterium]|nr:MAG: alpha/beta fold hydrolase [Dehalococcoidia bacterium]